MRHLPTHKHLHWFLIYPLLFPYGDHAWRRDMEILPIPDHQDVVENIAHNVVNDVIFDPRIDQPDTIEGTNDNGHGLTERAFWRYHLQNSPPSVDPGG